MNGYDLEYIDKLRIHELRDFAKKLGVSSPTTMKKEELIGKISSIIKGDTSSNDNSKKYIKNCNEVDFFNLLISDNSNVLDTLLNKKSDTDKSNQLDEDVIANNTLIMKKKPNYDSNTPYPVNDMVGFSFSINQNEAKYNVNNNENIFNVEGFVDIHPSGYGILRFDGYAPNSKDSYLTTSILKKYNLKKGYYIYGKAKFIMENKPKIVYEINQIEDATKIKNTQDFDDLPYNGLGDEFYLDKFDLTIHRGERHYIENMSLKDAVDLGFDLVDENGVNVKLINIKARPEEQYNSHQKMEVINVLFNKPDAEVVNTVQLVLERIKREIEMNKSNVLIIYNFSELIRIINIACSDGVLDFSKFNSLAINKINNILYIAKNIEKSLSSSVICIDSNGVPSDLKTLMTLEFQPLFNKIHNKINSK